MGGDGELNELIVQKEIGSYEDLRGKTVIVDAPDTAYALLLYKTLEVKGLKRGDYTVKAVGGSLRRYEVMVQDNSHAAAMLNPPFSVRAKQDGLKSLGSSVNVTGPYQASGIFVLRDWGRANSDPLVKYLQALIEGLRWAMNPQNKDEVVAMLSDRLRLPPQVAAESFALAADPEKGFARDAKFDLQGFRNVLKLRAEILRTPGTDPNNPQKYLDLSYYEKALAGLS